MRSASLISGGAAFGTAPHAHTSISPGPRGCHTRIVPFDRYEKLGNTVWWPRT